MEKNFSTRIESGIYKVSEDIRQAMYAGFEHKDFINAVKNTIKYDVKISFAIMAYNEERVIERCIRSIEALADEIIVVDTGSNDRTIPIIKTLFPGVRLYQKEFKDDFSGIRNELTALATNEWIFQIDADEYLADVSREELVTYIALLEQIAIEPKIISPMLTNHDGTIIDNTRRLYKKNSALNYYGRVHEELRFRNIAKTPYLIIHLNYYHDGYQKEIIENKRKYERNIALLEKTIAEEADHPRWYYFLAREMGYANYEAERIKPVLEQGLKLTLHKNAEYVWGLIDLSMQCPLGSSDTRLLYECLAHIKEITPQCMDIYYYELLLKTIACQKSLLHMNENVIDSVTQLEQPISLMDEGGSHIFYLLGWNYLACQRIDLAFSMWRKMDSEQYIRDLLLCLRQIHSHVLEFLKNSNVTTGTDMDTQ